MKSATSPNSFEMVSQSSMNMEMKPLEGKPISGLDSLMYRIKTLEELGDKTFKRLNPIRGLNNFMYHGKALRSHEIFLFGIYNMKIYE